MTTFNRVRELKEDERRALVQGTISHSRFTMRRSHSLLWSGEGMTPPLIAQRLHCGDQTVQNVIRAFEREGLACLQEKSSRPHHDNSTFTTQGLQLKSRKTSVGDT
jgi:transposase